MFGVLLNPSIKGFMKGYILLPHMVWDAESESAFVADISFIAYNRIPYPINSSFIFGSGLIPILLPSIDDPAHRDQAFALLCDRLLSGNALKMQNGEEWYALTDLKRSGDAVAFAGSYDKMSEIMGAPLYDIKDPVKSFKILLPPSRLQITGSKGLVKPGFIRVALADIDAIKTDGGIVSKIGLKHSDYDKEGKVGPARFVKYSYQVRHNTIKHMDGHKKGKVTYDPALHRMLCKRAGINYQDCDMIMAIDNIKSTTGHGVGDIIEIPIEEMRVIKMKERQSPTRGGAQIRRIPWQALRELMAEKGAENVAAATVMKFASWGNAHAISHILEVPFNVLPAPVPELKAALNLLAQNVSKDTQQYFEDGMGLFIQLLAAARWVGGPTDGHYKVPMYGDAFAAIMGRLRAWYFDRVIKVQLGDFSFYVEVAAHLKGSDCILPNNKELLEVVNTEGVHLTGMRPPIVSRGNLQPLTPMRRPNGAVRVNRTDDTIYVSPESLLSMFGDTDGDVLYLINSHTKFKLRIRKVVEEPKFKYLASTPDELSRLIKNKSSQVAQASLEVGLRDRAASILYDERQMAGNPITDNESVKMADEWLENAIKSFKHDGTSVMGEAAIEMMCAEYGTESIRKSRMLPKTSLPQTQLFRRKIGAFGPRSHGDKVKMKSLAFELERFFTHKPNVAKGVCVSGTEDAHPFLPVFEALRGFVFEEDVKQCQLDHKAFIDKWDATKLWLDTINARLKYRIIDRVQHVEATYNSAASYAITLSSYNGEEPQPWWPFCIFNSIENRRAWATHIFKNDMKFEFIRESAGGYKNQMSGYITEEELYELLATGRISTLQKRARFAALRDQLTSYVANTLNDLHSESGVDRVVLHKTLVAAMAYRVFGMKKSGREPRNAREFMSMDDNIKLSVYNVVFKSPWGLVARGMWDTLLAFYKELDVECKAQEDEKNLESVEDGSLHPDNEGF